MQLEISDQLKVNLENLETFNDLVFCMKSR